MNAGTNSAEPCKRRTPGHAGASVRKVFLDCTVGMGGHSFEILRRFPDVELVGFDLDRDALEQAARRLAPFGVGFILYTVVFPQTVRWVWGCYIERFAGGIWILR